MIYDSIGDMMTRLRNATLIQAKEVSIPKSKINLTITQILEKEGWLLYFEDNKKDIRIGLKYKQMTVSTVSKQSFASGFKSKKTGFKSKQSKQMVEDPSIVSIVSKQSKQKKVPYMTNLTRISKPGLRIYMKKKESPKVLGGIGIAILSTSLGVMTDRQARAQKIGGEILCSVW
jgi:small subunit ribosomal protein S8